MSGVNGVSHTYAMADARSLDGQAFLKRVPALGWLGYGAKPSSDIQRVDTHTLHSDARTARLHGRAH